MRSGIASTLRFSVCGLLLFCGSPIFAQNEEAPKAPPPNDPLVVKPTTIEGKFDAALFLLKLARPELARYYLEQVLADNPTDEDLLKLRNQHGTGTFLQLAGLKDLNPPATELLDRLNKAVQKFVTTPGYAEGLLQKLEGTPRERAEAIAELRHLGPYAVPPILQSLVRDQNASRETLALALMKLGSDAVPPLIGALDAPDAEVQAVAAQVLGHIGGSDDAIWLWSPAFQEGLPTGTQTAAREALARLIYGSANDGGRLTADGAARKLLIAATRHLSGKHTWPALFDESQVIPVWTWDPQTTTVVEHPAPRPLASIFFAERLAREAARLAPELQSAPVILLASQLARDVEQSQWNLPLSADRSPALNLAVRVGPQICEEVLRFALDEKLTSAALGSLQALRLNGSPHLLLGGPVRSAVADALNAPDSRIQFAAATTILSWEPTRNFRGARRVVEILARALNSSTTPASVVVDPNISRANATAGLFTEVGYNASLAATGMDGFRIASEQGNIALAVLHPNVIRWGLSETIANLRADARTAAIPIIIYGPAADQDSLAHYSREFQNVAYLNEATEPVEINRNLQPVLAELSPPPLTPQQRSQQIAEAAFWLRRLAVSNVHEIFDLAPAEDALSKAISVPQLTEDALVALSAIGRPSVQETLLQLALAPAVKLGTRQFAASQLAFHIEHYGSLLTPASLAALRSALAAEQDAQLHLALASVIGALKPSAAAARLEILREPASSAPVSPVPASPSPQL